MSDLSHATHADDRTATSTNHSDSPPAGEFDQAMQQIRDALRGLRFGNVSIIVQDGVVIQIDRTEKRRVRRSAR